MHPSGVYITKLENVVISTEMELQTAIFFILYLVTLFVTALLLSSMNVDGMTSISASIATIGNAGPVLEKLSSLGNYSSIPDAGKYVLSINMLLGRLEIINVFALFTGVNLQKITGFLGRKMYLCTLFNGYLASLKCATHYSTVN